MEDFTIEERVFAALNYECFIQFLVFANIFLHQIGFHNV